MCSSCEGAIETRRALQRGQRSGRVTAAGKRRRGRRGSDDELGRRYRPVGSAAAAAAAPVEKPTARLRSTGADMKSHRDKGRRTDGCGDGKSVRDSCLARGPLSIFPLRRVTGIGGEGPGPNVAAPLAGSLIVLVARDGQASRWALPMRRRSGQRARGLGRRAPSGQQVELVIHLVRAGSHAQDAGTVTMEAVVRRSISAE